MYQSARLEGAATRRLLVGGAAVLVVAITGYLVLPRVAAELLYQLVGWSAVVAFMAGAVRHRAPLPPVLALAAGWACFVAGDLLFAVYDVILHDTPFPSPADVLYLAGYPLLAAGVLALSRRRQPRGDQVALIDAGIVTVSFTTLAWVYLIGPYTNDGTLSMLEKVVSIAYPAGDLLCLAVLVRLLIAGPPGERRVTPSLAFLSAAFAVVLVIDVAFTIGTVTDTYNPGGVLDAMYLVPYVLVGMAGLHPSVHRIADPLPASEVTLSRPRMALLAFAAILTPGMMAVEAGLGHSLAVPVIVGGTTVVFLLVVVRMASLVDALEVSRAQLAYDASHDSLTGLANRTLLVRSLVAAMAANRPMAVIFIDLDHFKTVNDTFGHLAGDLLLVEAGVRLRATAGPGLSARVAGDEFAVLLADVPQSTARTIAERIAERLNEPSKVDAPVPTLSASVGLACWNGRPAGATRQDPLATVETLLERADVAMYEAKRTGRGRLVVIEPDELVERRNAPRSESALS
jgi:diguanylate cyclase (GGDEF)-like protein